MGWRLGGKGASSRGVNGRVEEHGLHLWLGFYENAFRLIRDCYEELDRDPASCPIATFEDAFQMDDWVSVTDRLDSGEWDVWTAKFPRTPGLPGDPFSESNPFHFHNYIRQAIRLLIELFASLSSEKVTADTEKFASGEPEERLERLLKVGQLATTAAVVEAMALLHTIIQRSPGSLASLEGLIQRVQDTARRHLHTLALADNELRRIWTIADLVLACLRGVFRFSLYSHPNGFDAINDYDWLAWLKLNGADETTLESAFVRGSCYDLTFAFEKGDPEKPAFAAGVALRCALRMFFTYRGAVFYKMSAGMGEIVFAPIYEVLRRRGVTVKFFHKLTNVDIAEDGSGTHVSGLRFDIQAADAHDYDPLVDVGGVPCWPEAPRFKQSSASKDLERQFDSTVVEKTHLKVTRDFDYVVLAVSLGTIPEVCGDILERDEKWRLMVEHVTTVGTQAFQLWLKEDMASLGYKRPGGNLSGFVPPFDTWADMTRVVEYEGWQDKPRSLAYFCSSLSEEQLASSENASGLVQENARNFLDTQIYHLWPGVRGEDGKFRHDLVCDDGIYFRANWEHSERYVQSLPGSVRHRISPLDRTYDNLSLAGDWTRNGLDAGCVEAAVISGRLAAHAISGLPLLEDIVGFDHP